MLGVYVMLVDGKTLSKSRERDQHLSFLTKSFQFDFRKTVVFLMLFKANLMRGTAINGGI